MTFGITVKRRNPYKPVHAIFTFQVSERIITFKLKCYGFNTCNLTRLIIKFFYFVAFFFAPHNIHTHKHRSPVTTFGTAGTGCNL